MIRKIARPMLASAFVASGADMIMNPEEHREGTQQLLTKLREVLPAEYAQQIPTDPELVSKALGGTQVASATLLALGKAPRLTSAALAAVALPSMLARYAFWDTQDPQEKQAKRTGLLTNVALLGGLMITSADTQGKPGLAWRAQHASKKVQAALPSKAEQENFVEKVTSYIDDNKDDWLDRAQEHSEAAKNKFVTVAAQAQERAEELRKVAEQEAGRAQKKASKQAATFQKKAEKATAKAQKKLKKYDI